jgi:ParB family transcriptional regulator, chromosome partitioning protein
MPRRRPSTTLLDPAIDDRLDHLAVLRFGQPQAMQELRVDRIAPNPVQRFEIFEAAKALAAVMREQEIMYPLCVRPHPDKARWYQLLYGQQRQLAASVAGYYRNLCVVVDADDATLEEFGRIEALQRVPLPPLEEADILRWLLDTRGYTFRSLAAWLGRKKGSLENRLALLRMPADLQQLVVARPETLSAALQLAKVGDAEIQTALLSSVRDGLLTVEAIRAEVRALRRKDRAELPLTVDTLPPDRSGVDTRPPDQADTNMASVPAALRILPGEVSIQGILMRWKALRQDETMRQKVDAALARTLARIAEIGEVP